MSCDFFKVPVNCKNVSAGAITAALAATGTFIGLLASHHDMSTAAVFAIASIIPAGFAGAKARATHQGCMVGGMDKDLARAVPTGSGGEYSSMV